jgi:hypothetical protein
VLEKFASSFKHLVPTVSVQELFGGTIRTSIQGGRCLFRVAIRKVVLERCYRKDKSYHDGCQGLNE